MRLLAVSKNTPGERCNWLTITRSVPLMMNVPLSVISGTSPKKTSCSLMSRMERLPVSGILVVNGQAHGDLERSGVSHAALFALGHVVLQLQADRVAALVAEVGRVGVVSAALLAKHFAGMKRIGDDRGAAIPASGAQVVQPFQVAALALPVADGVIHELQLRDVAEVGDRKHRLKYRLQAGVVALAGQPVHLQKAVIGTPLHFDQIRNLDRCWNFGKIESLAEGCCSSPFRKLPRPLGAAQGCDRTREI